MKWTIKKPTKPGWYWHRCVHTKSSAEVVLVYYDYTGNLAVHGDRIEWMFDVEWSSESVKELKEG